MAKIQVFIGETLQSEISLEAGKDYEVGQGADCGIRFDDPSVSDRHCVLKAGDGQWTVENRAPEGTPVNGERAETQVLKHRDRIELGRHVLIFDDTLGRLTQGIAWTVDGLEGEPGAQAGGPPPAANASGSQPNKAAEAPRPRTRRMLLILSGLRPRAFHLDKDTVLIGKAPHCDLRIVGSFVRKEQAVVIREPHGYRILCQGGLRSVRVNGARVSDAILQPGDVITIGGNIITVRTL